jgi:energy-coupling factor transport system substrate-specific component
VAGAPQVGRRIAGSCATSVFRPEVVLTTISHGTRKEAAGQRRWRTVDIVVGAAMAVAFGVVYEGWALLWYAVDPVLFGFKPLGGVMVGVWLSAGVVGALVLRRPGAALFVQLVAAVVEALLGSQWGASTIVYGLLQGLAIEVVFAGFRYRRWSLAVSMIAGALAGGVNAILDFAYYYGSWSIGWKTAYVAASVASGLVIAGVAGWSLVRGMARTGVLAPFPSGRAAPRA